MAKGATKGGNARRFLLVLAISLVGLASLYGSGGLDKVFSALRAETAGAQCAAATALSTRLKPLAKGEIAALQVIERPAPMKSLAFRNANDEAVTLESFRGKAILLNLWATWCAPCKHEMPALDRLQGELGGADFEVVAVNIDTRNFEKPKQFYAEANIEKLAFYADPQAKIFQELKSAGKAFGMPTTLLIDKAGCELARLAGPAEWSSPEAAALVKAALGK